MIFPIDPRFGLAIVSSLFGLGLGTIGRSMLDTTGQPDALQVNRAREEESQRIRERETADLNRRAQRLDMDAVQPIGRQVKRRPLDPLRLGRLTEFTLDDRFNPS